DGSTTGVELVHDGATYVVRYAANPCARQVFDSPTGWVFGSSWADHVRLAAGADLAALAPVTSAELALAPDPRPVDCAVDDVFDLGQEPYPSLRLGLVGGTATVLDVSTEEAGRAPGEYPSAQLVDGAWTTDTAATDAEGEYLAFVDADGRPAVVEQGPETLRVAVLDGAATEIVDPRRPVVGAAVQSAAWADQTAWIVTRDSGRESGFRVGVWRSTSVAEDQVPTCDLAPGALCPGVDLTLVDGYPDFAGADLSGADLRAAVLGDGNFDGASFRGTLLGDARASRGASFVGTDFTGAGLRGASLSGLDGVVLTGAALEFAFLDLVGLPASLADVALSRASLRFDPALGPLDLSGLDLTDANVGATFGDDLLVIGDLRGAIVEGLDLDRVDLRQANLEGIDLSLVTLGEESICPDGSAPTGERSWELRCG
ncbi:MAG TPA: pentapeptide repeat-containing protein, partial [Acidimicrobiales bacterium]|nr:pentapeptide repeat-containing protein [Acidimicrobiales bacterium]